MRKPIKQIARVFAADGVTAQDAADVDHYINRLEAELEKAKKDARGARGELRDLQGY